MMTVNSRYQEGGGVLLDHSLFGLGLCFDGLYSEFTRLVEERIELGLE